MTATAQILHGNTDAFDEDLNPLLETATNEDLAPLVQYIIERGGIFSRLDSHPVFREHYPEHTVYADVIAEELRRFGGHALANVWRGHGARYRDIVHDVADRVRANYSRSASVATVETAILQRLAEDAWERMDDEQRRALLSDLGVKYARVLPAAFPVMALQAAIKASGVGAYHLAAVIANAVAKALLGHVLGVGARLALSRTITAFAGPVGWVLTGAWAAYELLGPAYRVTVPCIIHIAMLRQKSMLLVCPRCGALNPQGNAYCAQCGAELEVED